MASIPLSIQPVNPMFGAQVAQAGPSLQALINQTRLQQQQQQQNAALNPIIQQRQQQALQQEQIQTQQAQQQQDDQQAFNKAFKDANGDWDQAIEGATKNGASGMFITQAQLARANQVATLARASSDVLANHQTKLNQESEAMLAVQNADPADRQNVFNTKINELKMTGQYRPGELPETLPSDDQLQSMIYGNKATLDMVKDAQAAKDAATKAPSEAATALANETQKFAQLLANSPDDVHYQGILQGAPDNVKSQFPEHWSADAIKQVSNMAISPEERLKALGTGVEPQEMAAFLKANPGKTPWDFAQEKAKLTPLAQIAVGGGPVAPAAPGAPGGPGGPPLTAAQKLAASVGLTPEALDQAAQTYLQTGQLPPGARGGAAGLRQNHAVMNRAAELDPNNNIMASKGILAANADSLKAIQKNFDNVSAFENTAGKNLDTFLNTAKNVVDTGSPFLNTPVRMVTSQMVGSENMAAFNAARTTALTEIAKVLNSSNASGVLSDSARGEVEQLIGPNANLAQIYSAANILKQDMANRHQSYQEQINDIQGRMKAGGKGNEQTTQTQPSSGFTVPQGAPAAPAEDGHKLKQNGNVIAISKGGKWVAPASQ